MHTNNVLRTGVAALAVSLAVPAMASPKSAPSCAEGKILVRGQCATPCPTHGRFADALGCECPPGFGKIVSGNGSGECARVTCGTGPGMVPKLCGCPDGFEKRTMRTGKAVCVASKRKGKPVNKAT